jgi:hypothetical protein
MSYNSQIYANVVSQGLRSGSEIKPSEYSGFISQALLRISDIQNTQESLNPNTFSSVFSKFFNKTNNKNLSRVMAVAFIDACEFNSIDPL